MDRLAGCFLSLMVGMIVAVLVVWFVYSQPY